MNIRTITTGDYSQIINVVDDWWGGRAMRDMLPKLFFTHFQNTSFIADQTGERIGFLIGLLSQTYLDEAYIHFVGVHPRYRNAGVGQMLYERFFEVARGAGRHIVRCVTSPSNKTSIAFHRRMGFVMEQSEFEVDGIPIAPDYDGQGGHRVLFARHI